jgi:hypothetical protein
MTAMAEDLAYEDPWDSIFKLCQLPTGSADEGDGAGGEDCEGDGPHTEHVGTQGGPASHNTELNFETSQNINIQNSKTKLSDYQIKLQTMEVTQTLDNYTNYTQQCNTRMKGQPDL